MLTREDRFIIYRNSLRIADTYAFAMANSYRESDAKDALIMARLSYESNLGDIPSERERGIVRRERVRRGADGHASWCALYAGDPAAGKECDCA
jgi:hypothetical protein